MTKLKRAFAAIAASLMFSGTAQAETADSDFPKKLITIVVPYSSGGLSDLLARDMASEIGKKTGQSAVVLNKPGGAAQMAMATLKDAPADGYTLFVGDIAPLALNAGLFSKLTYSPLTDLQAVTQLVDSPILLVVKDDSPYQSFDDLINDARSGQQMLAYASQGTGTGGHLFGTLLAKKLDVPLTHVPYRGALQGLQDVIAGEVDFMYDAIPSSGPFVKSGKLRALAVGAKERSSLFPDVPTLQELGYGEIGPSFWWGVVGKAGTPEPVVARLNELFIDAISNPDVAQKYTDQGLNVVTSSPTEFSGYIRSEIEKWSPVIRDAGMVID